ncbi:hypothetical protein V5F53_06655 [Xanthobacter sp. V4C-4]|uniref:hypothetical protein n=1 Tax=Xanthobacter cornucopiae TaxID=3119924 RepID=UPI003728CA2E
MSVSRAGIAVLRGKGAGAAQHAAPARRYARYAPIADKFNRICQRKIFIGAMKGFDARRAAAMLRSHILYKICKIY